MTEIMLTGGHGSMHTIDFASVDAALPFYYDAATYMTPSWHYGNWELDVLNLLTTGLGLQEPHRHARHHGS